MWEYKHLTARHEYCGLWQAPRIEYITEETLSNLGKEGWEIAAVSFQSGTEILAVVLKRKADWWRG
jgi:hypothetical protein